MLVHGKFPLFTIYCQGIYMAAAAGPGQSEGDPNGLCDLPAREKGVGSRRRVVVVVVGVRGGDKNEL